MTKLKIGMAVLLLGAGAFCRAQTPAATEQFGPAGPPRMQIAHKSVVASLAWSPDGKWIATATKDGTIVVTEAATGKEVRSFTVDKAAVAMAFASDGKTVAICGDDEDASFWNVETGKAQPGANGRARSLNPPKHLAFTNDDKFIVGVGLGSIYKWSLAGGCGVTTYSKRGDFAAIAIDGSACGWCDTNGHCVVHQYTPGDPINFRTKSSSLQVGPANSIAFGPGAKSLAVGGEKEVQLWDLTTQKLGTKLTGLDKPASKLALSADGKTLAAVTGDGQSIRVFDLAHNSTRCQVNQRGGIVDSLALSPDGKILATTTKEGKVLYVWKAAARELSNKGQQLDLSAKEMASLWTALADPDFEKADKAWRKLGEAGDNAIPFMREQIRAVAVPPVDMKRIEKFVADLDSDKFATRDKALKELEAVGDLAIVPLQRLLENPPSVEARERAKLVLKKLEEPVLTTERQRVLDAIELLEQVKTAKAIALLEEIEREALVPQIRLETRQALERLGKLGGEKKG